MPGLQRLKARISPESGSKLPRLLFFLSPVRAWVGPLVNSLFKSFLYPKY
jgi:hypothetical protein